MSNADTIITAIKTYDADHQGDEAANVWEDLLQRKPLADLIAWDQMPPAGQGDDVIVTTDGTTIRYQGGEWVEV